MIANLVFCEECRNDVEYVIVEVQMSGSIKGKEYNYAGKEARCVHCGNVLFVDEINDYNLTALYNIFRDKNGIVPLSTVLAVPDKYAIGKRPLSVLLGWGEQTYSRYCDGDVPTKQFSDTIAQIYDDPMYYAGLLEVGKERLTTTAYEKSRKAVESLMGLTGTDTAKIDIAIKYLLSKCGDITPLALQKALYYIQGFYFAFYEKFLFQENCEAWVHGPVYRDVYLRYRNYSFDPIKVVDSFDESLLTASEKAVFDSVIDNLCCYSGKILEKFTHNETPWLDARGDLPLNASSERVISKESIGNYFVAVKSKYNMMKPNDIHSYAISMFNS